MFDKKDYKNNFKKYNSMTEGEKKAYKQGIYSMQKRVKTILFGQYKTPESYNKDKEIEAFLKSGIINTGNDILKYIERDSSINKNKKRRK